MSRNVRISSSSDGTSATNQTRLRRSPCELIRPTPETWILSRLQQCVLLLFQLWWSVLFLSWLRACPLVRGCFTFASTSSIPLLPSFGAPAQSCSGPAVTAPAWAGPRSGKYSGYVSDVDLPWPTCLVYIYLRLHSTLTEPVYGSVQATQNFEVAAWAGMKMHDGWGWGRRKRHLSRLKSSK